MKAESPARSPTSSSRETAPLSLMNKVMASVNKSLMDSEHPRRIVIAGSRGRPENSVPLPQTTV